ncbi:MAG TPA: xanthine dehydrogenase family protein molybdopterin-binding subunit [Candidatus Lambdaproteobacteria bacterium]|nr:xanthine dehydrogenase family protein molybdopterin-binding subunit [Candidatus Lambdaproteobacteria bacterium]
MKNTTMNRRTFLKVSAVAGSGLLVGCTFEPNPNLSAPTAKSEELGLFIRISKDNSITIISPTSEMGQGTHTAHAMIIADELEADWKKINVVTTHTIRSEYNTSSSVSTGGNRGIRLWWDRLAKIGAGTRELLIEAGAQKMGVSIKECEAQNGHVLHRPSSRKLSYGQLAEAASRLKPPSSPKLKSKDRYRFVGKPMPRLDIPEKVNGSAIYGTDVRLPGMRYAAVSQSPVFGGEVKAYDKAAAMAVRGVEAVIPVPHGMSVVADSTWHAQKGLEALKVQFEGGATAGLDQEELGRRFRTSLDDMGKTELSGEKVLDLEYEIQFLSHAALEPINCTASVTDHSCEVWGPFQSQTRTLNKVKEVTELPEEQIKVHTTYVGGGFGRKDGEDFSEQAVMISKALKKPVQVMWSREEDIQHDFYHPASRSRFQISLGNDGLPSQWENQQAAGSQWVQDDKLLQILDLNPLAYSSSQHSGLSSAMASAFAPKFKPHYDIEGVDFEQTVVDLEIPLGWWRSFMFQNTFFLESAMDESAHLAGEDPFEYRIKLLRNSPRFKKALELVAEDANWGSPLAEGHGRGIAICNFSGSVCAEVAEVSVSKRGKLVVHRVDCAIDVGRHVNPDTLKAQVEGCVIWGISIATSEEITFKDGRVEQSNYDDYRIARMRNAPEINVRVIDSEHGPFGGDAGLPPTPPAITNAIFAATGKRIRRLPIGRQKLV